MVIGDEVFAPKGVGVVAVARQHLDADRLLAGGGAAVLPVAAKPRITMTDGGLEVVARHEMQARPLWRSARSVSASTTSRAWSSYPPVAQSWFCTFLLPMGS